MGRSLREDIAVLAYIVLRLSRGLRMHTPFGRGINFFLDLHTGE